MQEIIHKMQNANNQPKLTISLLVSNRKDTVPKCLDSLRPLLEQVDSELIITDTGCDDDLVEYMKKYTDKIVKFTWCSDFAAARNVGLKMAKGQWFMYIDDDEWFENVDELVTFFNSDEEKKYNSASYVVRNYISMKGDTYSEGVVGRIFRIENGMEFVGKVHEQIKRPEGLEKQFVSFVHHYGYVFESDEKRIAHFERNTSLLKKEIEEHPDRARNYAHIYQEYKVMRDIDSALGYALKALDSVLLEEKENIISMGSTYVCILWGHNAKKEYDKTISWGELFLSTKPLTALVRAALMSYLAQAYAEEGNYPTAIECADEYISLFGLFQRDRERYYKELAPLLNDTFKDTRSGIAYSAGLKGAANLGDLEKCVSYLLAYDWSKSIYMLDSDCLKDFVALAAGENYNGKAELYRDVVRAFGKIFTNVSSSNIVLGAVSGLKNQDEKKYLVVCNIMAKVTGQLGYNDLVSIITSYRSNDIEKLEMLYEKVVTSKESVFCMEREFYEIAFEKRIGLGRLINKMSVDSWRDVIISWISKTRNKDIVIYKYYFDNISDMDNQHRDIFEQILVKELDNRRKS